MMMPTRWVTRGFVRVALLLCMGCSSSANGTAVGDVKPPDVTEGVGRGEGREGTEVTDPPEVRKPPDIGDAVLAADTPDPADARLSPDPPCQPDCADKECGDDGCGQSCGFCPQAAPLCEGGKCQLECVPDCAGKECDTDGCGGSCGQCSAAQHECQDGLCTCTPACELKECGDDGCGGACGYCGAQGDCLDGVCFCQPNCADLECGGDGCGGSCGDCEQGTLCADGLCKSNCDLIAGVASNLGCDFWAVDLDNIEGGQTAKVALMVSVPSTFDNAEIFVLDWSESPPEMLGPSDLDVTDMSVLPGAAKVFLLPTGNDIDGSELSGKSYRIGSSNPVSVHQFNPLNSYEVFTNDASLLLPAQRGGFEYLVLSWPLRTSGNSLRGFATVVATQGGTTNVEVWPTSGVESGTGVQSVSADPVEPYEFALQRGDVLNLETAGAQGADLTGTRIKADQKIGVFGGHECANIPLGTNYCDHVEQQLLPVTMWGNNYIADAFAPRSASQVDTWRVISAGDGTTVETNPVVAGPYTLDKGEWEEFETGQHFEISATGPILVGHYLQGSNYQGFSQTCSSSGIGDPAFSLVVPQKQYLSEYIVLIPDGYQEDYLNVTFQVGSEAQVNIDGVPMSQLLTGSPPEVGESGWAVAQVTMTNGIHTADSNMPFAVTAYGYDCDVSYAYPGGLGLQAEQ